MLSSTQSATYGQLLMLSPTLVVESLDALLLHPDPIVACTGAMQKTSKNSSKKSFADLLMSILNIEDRKAIPMSSTLTQLGIDSLTGIELQYIIQ